MFAQSVRLEIATTVGPPQEVTDVGNFVDLYELQFQFDMIVLLGFSFRFIKYLRVNRKMKVYMLVIYTALKSVIPFGVLHSFMGIFKSRPSVIWFSTARISLNASRNGIADAKPCGRLQL